MVRFTAKAVCAEELRDLETYAVVLAEEGDGSGRRLELQIALSFDEQDTALGMDTYCLCTEDGATHYGGVTSWTIERSLLTVRLDAPAADVLGVDDGFLVEFPSSKFDELKGGLERVLTRT